MALVLVGWSIDAVSGSPDDQPSSGSEPSSSSSADDSSSSRDDEDKSADSSGSDETNSKNRTYRVVKVVDGDTVILGNGETVRLGGIDAPEVGECGFKRARNKLSRLVLDKRVSLGATDEDRDQYGRMLRYVDVDGTDSGLRLIKDGLSIARYDSRDGYGFHPREPKYIKADEASKAYVCAKPVPLVSQPKPKKKPKKLCAWVLALHPAVPSRSQLPRHRSSGAGDGKRPARAGPRRRWNRLRVELRCMTPATAGWRSAGWARRSARRGRVCPARPRRWPAARRTAPTWTRPACSTAGGRPRRRAGGSTRVRA